MSASFYDLGDRVLCVCPKAGSQSLRRTLGATRELQIHAIGETAKRNGKEVTVFLRHPIKRLRSAYRYFTTTGWHKDMEGLYGRYVSYQGFVDAILDGCKNRHWDSQVDMLRYNNQFICTEVFRFEDINEVWPTICDKPLAHINASPPQTVNETYRLEELDNLYREDLEIWRSASVTTG